MQQGTDYHTVYSNFFLSCWTNDVEDFPKVTWIISPPSCQIRFFDCCPWNFFNSRRKDWQCSQYLTLNPTCATGFSTSVHGKLIRHWSLARTWGATLAVDLPTSLKPGADMRSYSSGGSSHVTEAWARTWGATLAVDLPTSLKPGADMRSYSSGGSSHVTEAWRGYEELL